MRPGISEDCAVLVLAGGRAQRLPRKLERDVGGVPMVLRVYRAMRETGWPVYVSGGESLAREIDAALDCPLLVDRLPYGGPLRALLSACGSIARERIFVVAADEPGIDATLPQLLERAWQPADEAVVPEHDGRLEPLAAFYARSALLQQPFTNGGEDGGAMHGLIGRLRARRVPVPGRYFTNVNTAADLARLTKAAR